MLNMILAQQTHRTMSLSGEKTMKPMLSCLIEVSAHSQDVLSLGIEAKRV